MLAAPEPYSTEWPRLFARYAAAIRPGDWQIAHIGSTAVPGLAAKPVIDMQLGVPDLTAFDWNVLDGSGFIPAPEITQDDPPAWHPDQNPRQWTKKYARLTKGTERCAHLHIRQIGAPNHRFALLFRDYLRAHPKACALYAEMKMSIAAATATLSHPGGSGPYLDLKTPFVTLIGLNAEDWAARSGWTCPQT